MNNPSEFCAVVPHLPSSSLFLRRFLQWQLVGNSICAIIGNWRIRADQNGHNQQWRIIVMLYWTDVHTATLYTGWIPAVYYYTERFFFLVHWKSESYHSLTDTSFHTNYQRNRNLSYKHKIWKDSFRSPVLYITVSKNMRKITVIHVMQVKQRYDRFDKNSNRR